LSGVAGLVTAVWDLLVAAGSCHRAGGGPAGAPAAA